MRRRRLAAIGNPFYVLLVFGGILFFITACAYAVMTFRGRLPTAGAAEQHPLLVFLDQHGALLLGCEIGLLAVFTCAAMATDSYWIRRTQAGDEHPATSPPGPDSSKTSR